jgi:hypothetical protein
VSPALRAHLQDGTRRVDDKGRTGFRRALILDASHASYTADPGLFVGESPALRREDGAIDGVPYQYVLALPRGWTNATTQRAPMLSVRQQRVGERDRPRRGQGGGHGV